MSTRGVIAFEHVSGMITASYCHNDNYLSGTGHMLIKYWNDPARAEALASHGYMSIVAETIDDIREQSSHAHPSPDDEEAYEFDGIVELGKSDIVHEANYVYMYTLDRGWMVAQGNTEVLLFAPLVESLNIYGHEA